MDQLDMAVGAQLAAERQARVIRDAEHRRILRERAAAQPKPLGTAARSRRSPAPWSALLAWMTAHLHVATRRPVAR